MPSQGFEAYAQANLLGISRAIDVHQGGAPSTDLLIAAEAEVAVLGFQWSGGWPGNMLAIDSFYLLLPDREAKQFFRREFGHGGRVWPTALSSDGKTLTYAYKADGAREPDTRTIDLGPYLLS